MLLRSLSGADSIFRGGGAKIFSSGLESQPKDAKELTPTPKIFFCLWGITKEILVLAPAPYVPHESFFLLGAETYNFEFHQGYIQREGIYPHDLIHQRYMPLTPLKNRIKNPFLFTIPLTFKL